MFRMGGTSAKSMNFAGKLGFQPKVLGNYTHFLGSGNCLGAAAGIELCEDV
jgi:hypothetical protein